MGYGGQVFVLRLHGSYGRMANGRVDGALSRLVAPTQARKDGT